MQVEKVEKVEEGERKFKTIKVRKETYEALLSYQSALQLVYKKRLSLDQVINVLMQYAPVIEYQIRSLSKEEIERLSGGEGSVPSSSSDRGSSG